MVPKLLTPRPPVKQMGRPLDTSSSAILLPKFDWTKGIVLFNGRSASEKI